MGHTYSNLMYHCIFSTKQRRRLITDDIRQRIVPYVGGLIRQRGGSLLAMNGPEDHVHILAIFTPKVSVSDLLRDIKSISSGWVRQTFADTRDFAWQEGYAAFSVSKSNADEVAAYIAGQQEHHRTVSFEDEFRAFLERHGIEYDPRYVFD